MTRMSDEELRRMIPAWEACNKVITAKLARELIAARELIRAYAILDLTTCSPWSDEERKWAQADLEVARKDYDKETSNEP